jgi:hypothetical protein
VLITKLAARVNYFAMKRGAGEHGGKVTIEDFDPRGPPNRAIDSPRSLVACEQVGVLPQDLFLWSAEEFEMRLAQEGIESKDPAADYEKYLEEFEAILTAVKDARKEVITKMKTKKNESRHGKV